MTRSFNLILIIFLSLPAFCQVDFDPELVNWMEKDPVKDEVYGISLAKCYKELIRKKKAKKKVIVAVLDTGVDIEHEDLKNFIWFNEDEIPANGIDDDNNGYIDDIHGWNFLGNSKGENIGSDNYEYARLYKTLSLKFDEKTSKSISKKDKKEYQTYLDAKNTYLEKLSSKRKERKQIDIMKHNLLFSFETFKSQIDINNFTLEDINNLETISEDQEKIKSFLTKLFEAGFLMDDFNALDKRNNEYLNKHLNLDFTPRKEILGDDINTLTDMNYGNNDVEGPKASHGTSVAGFIAAERNNKIGINGVCNSAEIMVLRIVPNGDEYDKDVALAIRYAADNGASIINMSFGKAFSPQKQLIDEAITYAQTKDILFVHAAGNDGMNIDKGKYFPVGVFSSGKKIENWIDVGANGDIDLIASFSNYGRKTVDLFAPGHKMVGLDINDNYDITSGTSLAAPVVSGLAALLMSYYPKLTASDIKTILLDSSTKYKKAKVMIVNEDNYEEVKKFKKLSVTSGIANAYKAFKMAKTYKRK